MASIAAAVGNWWNPPVVRKYGLRKPEAHTRQLKALVELPQATSPTSVDLRSQFSFAPFDKAL